MKASDTTWAKEAVADYLDAAPGPYAPKGDEADRIQRVRQQGMAAKACGAEIIRVAPARGSVVAFVPSTIVPVGSDGVAAVERGYKGRSALRVCDAFDKINAAILRRGARKPFDRRLIEAARAYADLTERVATAGVGCSSAFSDHVPGGASGDLDKTDRLMIMRSRLAGCHDAIGYGIAKEIRRRRPSKRDVSDAQVIRRAIFNRDLADMVCIQGLTLSGALEARGWSNSKENVKAVYIALWGILARLSRCF